MIKRKHIQRKFKQAEMCNNVIVDSLCKMIANNTKMETT